MLGNRDTEAKFLPPDKSLGKRAGGKVLKLVDEEIERRPVRLIRSYPSQGSLLNLGNDRCTKKFGEVSSPSLPSVKLQINTFLDSRISSKLMVEWVCSSTRLAVGENKNRPTLAVTPETILTTW